MCISAWMLGVHKQVGDAFRHWLRLGRARPQVLSQETESMTLPPCRRLGIPPDASFEEVQDARNFLYDVSSVFWTLSSRLDDHARPCFASTTLHLPRQN